MVEGKFHYAQELVSSNDTAAELVRDGAGSGTVVLAESQTRGRGRGGNSWSCPIGEGLLFSVVLEPDFKRDDWSRLAFAAGLALVDALADYSIEAKVKWPNDVWVNGKKCAGVLIEGCGDCVIVGIGLNVCVKSFPTELNATSMVLEGAREINREELLANIVKRLLAWGSRCGEGFCGVVEAVNEHCALGGKDIQLERNGVQISGRMIGTNRFGHLMLECDGEIETIAQADTVRLI